MLFPFYLLLLFSSVYGAIRQKRQSSIATEEGIEVPIALRSAITCLIPGIKENICLGPRIEALKRERIGLSERRGAAYGYKNGVDIRLLRAHNLPLIRDQTEIGHSVGAVVDHSPSDGVVEFGNRFKAFNAWKHNTGGLVEWDREGAGVDVGHRASAADDVIKLKWTQFGINVGPRASRTLVGPNTVGRTRGERLRPASNPVPSIYRGYHSTRGDWYSNQFVRPGDEYRTPSQQACPWCFAVEPNYPVEKLFP